MKSTAIIILNYNNASDTINCIESVEQFNTAHIKYIVVDNGSNFDCVQILKEYFSYNFAQSYSIFRDNQKVNESLPYISFLLSATNDGYAKGNNKGLHLAYQDEEIDSILILNNDILFIEDIIPQLIFDLNNTPDAAIICPVLYKKNQIDIDYTCARKALTLRDRFIEYLFLFRDTFGVLSRIRKKRLILLDPKLERDNLLEIELPSGSCMFLKKEFFFSIGLFDPNTFLYNEEDILFDKIKKTYKKNYIDPRIRCIHLGASTTTSKVPSRFILEASIQSNDYYLRHYTNAGRMYLLLMNIFYQLLRIKYLISIHIK